jgi:hypothetical protein
LSIHDTLPVVGCPAMACGGGHSPAAVASAFGFLGTFSSESISFVALGS